MAKLLIHASSGAEDPERATLPWIFGTKAIVAGQEVSVMLTMEAVRLVTEGGADGIQHAGQPPLPDLIRDFIDGGGTVIGQENVGGRFHCGAASVIRDRIDTLTC